MESMIRWMPYRTLSVVVLLFFLAPAFAAVKPWCKKEGDPNHPLSLEAMALGPLFDPAIRRDPDRMVEAVYAAWRRQQQAVMAARGEGPIPEAVAFEAILDRLREGERSLLNRFYFKIDRQKRSNKLVGSEYPGGALHFRCRDETPRELAQTNPQKANIGYTAFVLQVLFKQQLEAMLTPYAKQVWKRADAYEAYLTNGLPMWPWELAINSWGEDYEDLFRGPPRWQWVVMRPSAGVEIFWPSRKEAELEASLAIEPIGFVRYTDLDNYREWWGLSALVTLGSADNGVGLGGLIRYNNYALGIVRREDIDEAYVFLSFDLYEQVRETRARVDEARAKLEQLRTQWARDD